MADAHRSSPATVDELVGDQPKEWNFFQLVRAIEARFPEHTRFGDSVRPTEELIRFGQRPKLDFPATMIDIYRRPKGREAAARLYVNFFGLFGPNGAMPLVFTEYAFCRNRHERDRVLTSFLDMFHHRMLSFYYRAWANSRQTVSFDCREDAFSRYIASLMGLGMDTLRDRGSVPDVAKLHYAGLFAGQTRHADGLRAILQQYFGVPAKIVEFEGQWVELPGSNCCRLGSDPANGSLGVSLIVGSRVWTRQQRFRIRLGSMGLSRYRQLLPGKASLRRLIDWVRLYVGLELTWDLQLVLRKEEVPPFKLGGIGSQLGLTTWLRTQSLEADADNLVLGPFSL